MNKGISALFLAAVIAAAQEAPPATFHAGTRLVEVEVVVRNQPVRPPGAGEWFKWVLDSGPPFGPPGIPLKGLGKDDFTLLDQGKPQQIAVFRAGASNDSKPAALPPGAVSNRQDNRGRPVNGATAVLIDFLNAKFGCRGYERLGMARFLSSFAETDSRIALYTLGVNLHVLQDFTDDPKKLMETAAKLDQPHGELPAGLAGALRDLGDVMAVGGGEAESEAAQVHGPITVRALKTIIQHLSGVPGRKNLVWLMEDSRLVPPAVVAMAQQANIVLYPVLVGAIGAELGAGVACIGGNSHAIEDLAAATGGRAFYDALDLTFAVRAAEEDTTTTYVLGFYPAEETLDGKYHTITVKLHNKAPDKQPLEVHYRPGYLATKAAVTTPSPTPQELFEGPGASARIGLAGQATPDALHAGFYDVRVTVDLHDIHLEHRDGRFTGRFDFSIPNPSIKGTVKTGTADVSLTEEQLVEALDSGCLPFFSRNDIDVAIREAMDDGRVSYTLGFYASGDDRKPQVHELAVRVSRPGVTLRYRASYQTEAPQKPSAAAKADLAKALSGPIDATAIPIQASVTRTQDRLNLQAMLDVGSLDLILNRDRWTGNIEIAARFTTVDGVVAGDVFSKTMILNLRQSTYDAAMRGGFPYRNEFKIPAKAVELKLLFANPAAGKIGTLTIPLPK